MCHDGRRPIGCKLHDGLSKLSCNDRSCFSGSGLSDKHRLTWDVCGGQSGIRSEKVCNGLSSRVEVVRALPHFGLPPSDEG